MAYYP
ncbi:hypothetical protein, partial [Salmonella phage vB_SalS_TU03]